MSMELVMPFNHLILYFPLLLLPSIFPSIRVFTNELALLIRWPKYWGFKFSISPSSKYLWWISFRIFYLLAYQGTLKTPLTARFKSINFQCSAFFMVQFSQPYMTLGKTISLAIWTFVGKVMSLLFNILSRLGIAFLPRSKCHLISWLQSPSAVILESKKIVCHCFYFFPYLFALKWWD